MGPEKQIYLENSVCENSQSIHLIGNGHLSLSRQLNGISGHNRLNDNECRISNHNDFSKNQIHDFNMIVDSLTTSASESSHVFDRQNNENIKTNKSQNLKHKDSFISKKCSTIFDSSIKHFANSAKSYIDSNGSSHNKLPNCIKDTLSGNSLQNQTKFGHPLNKQKENEQKMAQKLNGSKSVSKLSKRKEKIEEPPYHLVLLCYLSYVILTIFGYLRDFMRKAGLEKNLSAIEKNREGYPLLYKNFESFYTRNIYRRIRDCWNRPIISVPGAYIDILDRVSHDHNWTFEHPGTVHKVVNMGSYNYLGFAENFGNIHRQILETINQKAVSICSPRSEFGTSESVKKLEQLMSNFLNAESCVVFGMGFATNSTNIACLARKGCLIISDELNHASLILGCRLSGATIRIFKHNDMGDLERKIRKYIVEGQPKTHRPWKKIIILVEGIYSMEGTITNLPELIRIKKRYKCYLYLDEAHSIGALGPNGGGVVDYYKCDPNDVDILMGTFTKSFGAAGGYLAGRKELVDHIRASSFSSTYADSMSPVISKQICCVVQALMGLDGTDQGAKRISNLARNTRYFRRKLSQLGFIVYGNDDSPVVPLLLCFCPKIAAVIRLAHEKGLGFIGAGFPATSLTTGRVRFCISASHTKEMLDRSLEVMNEIGNKIGIKYSRRSKETIPIFYDDS